VCDYTKALTVGVLEDGRWRPVTKLDMPSQTENIVLRGNLAYVANHTAGLSVVDVSDPAKPAMVAGLNPKIDCDGIALWKDCAVLYAHWESQLVLVDVSDPAKPRQLAVYQHDKGSFNQGEVQVADGFAYCTANTGLVIVDIRNPAGPKLAKVLEIGATHDVAVLDGYVFVAGRGRGLFIYDVSDPTSPVLAGRFSGRGRNITELAVRRVADPGKAGVSMPVSAPADKGYYVYAAGAQGMVLRFTPPARP
jgi:hypothetical protein